jgi:hypothetical protein
LRILAIVANSTVVGGSAMGRWVFAVWAWGLAAVSFGAAEQGTESSEYVLVEPKDGASAELEQDPLLPQREDFPERGTGGSGEGDGAPTEAVIAEPARRAERVERLDRLREIQNRYPLQVDDGTVLDEGFAAEVSIANRSLDPGAGFFLFPQLRYGTGRDVELLLSTELSRLEGDTQLGPVTGGVGVELLQEGWFLPGVSLTGLVSTRSEEAGFGAELALAATKTFSELRVHGNGRYALRNDAGDHWFTGLGVDHPLGQSVLLGADAFYGQRNRSDTVYGGELGTNVLLTESVTLMGAVGLQRGNGGSTDGRVLLGVRVGP